MDVHKWLTNDIYNSLETDLKSAIKQIVKVCDYGPDYAKDAVYNLETTLFLFGASEVVGVSNVGDLANPLEGQQYERFATAESRKKIFNNGTTMPGRWWTRTPAQELVNMDTWLSYLAIGYTSMGLENTPGTDVCGVCFGFCV